jgi:hypothetical protein
MTELTAIKRLAYTVGNKNKPNETDAEAINKVIEWFNISNEKITQDNLLFAKIYILVLKDLSNYYKSIEIANKEISRHLSLPLDFHIENLKNSFNRLEMDSFFESLNLKPTWDSNLKIEEIRQNILDNKEYFKTVNPNLFVESLETWDTNSIIANLNYSVNELINKHKKNL